MIKNEMGSQKEPPNRKEDTARVIRALEAWVGHEKARVGRLWARYCEADARAMARYDEALEAWASGKSDTRPEWDDFFPSGVARMVIASHGADLSSCPLPSGARIRRDNHPRSCDDYRGRTDRVSAGAVSFAHLVDIRGHVIGYVREIFRNNGDYMLLFREKGGLI